MDRLTLAPTTSRNQEKNKPQLRKYFPEWFSRQTFCLQVADLQFQPAKEAQTAIPGGG